MAAALLLVVLATVTSRWHAAAPPAEARVAVLPFYYRGDTALAYLGPGMASLLTGALDGVGGLHAVDQRVVTQALAAGGERPAGSSRLARSLGATVTIDGGIIEISGRLRITAALTEHGRGRDDVQHAVVEGTAAEFLQMVDRLAIELLGARLGTGDVELATAAAATTSSHEALAAFLTAERAYRSGDYAQAADGYLRAVGADSMLALAWYRLGIAADWTDRPDVVAAASARALLLADRLPFRERTMVQATAAWREGRADDAEYLLRYLTSWYAEDAAAWYQLGEIYFHLNTTRGRSLLEAREPFERALALDSTNFETLVHLGRIAAREGRRSDALALVQRAMALRPANRILELRAFAAFLGTDRAARDRIVTELRSAGPTVRYLVYWRVCTFIRDWEAAEALSVLTTQQGDPASDRGAGYFQRVQLAIGRGKLRVAEVLLDSLAAVDSTWSIQQRAALGQLPFISTSWARDARLRLLRWNVATGTPGRIVGNEPALLPAVKAYLAGVLALRDGDTVSARENLTQLVRLEDADAPIERWRPGLERGLRARIAWHTGQLDTARVLSGSGLQQLWTDAGGAPISLNTYDQLLHGQVLIGLERQEEALGWLGSLADITAAGFAAHPTALRLMADIELERGNRDAAAGHLREFLALWSDADPELQPVVDSVRSRLQAIENR